MIDRPQATPSPFGLVAAPRYVGWRWAGWRWEAITSDDDPRVVRRRLCELGIADGPIMPMGVRPDAGGPRR